VARRPAKRRPGQAFPRQRPRPFRALCQDVDRQSLRTIAAGWAGRNATTALGAAIFFYARLI
jgi:hypothetical protein